METNLQCRVSHGKLLCQLDQSVTAPGHGTHVADTVTAHQCHELWSHAHVAERDHMV